MFKKKKCLKCGKKIGEKDNFCPNCGFRNNSENEEDFGMWGKNDSMPSIKDILSMINPSTIWKLSREIDAQLKNNLTNEPGKPKQIKSRAFSINISTYGDEPRVNVSPLNKKPVIKIEEEKTKPFKQNNFTTEKIKEFASLEREEPKTEIRRLSNKVVYEIQMPGVKSIEDVSIMKLESSIEIKAISKKKAYAKIIPINLPIKKYNLSDGKLILELGIKN